MDPQKFLKELLDNLKSQAFLKINSINCFDFTTLYTTIPNDKIRSKLKEIIDQCFFHKNGNRRFKYVVLGYTKAYYVKNQSDVATKYSENDNIFEEFGGRIFQQTIGIPNSLYKGIRGCAAGMG